MNLSLQLYDIHKGLMELLEDENSVDQTTGELTEEAIKRLGSLEIQKKDLIHYIGLSYFNYKAESGKVDAEIERLQNIKKHYTTRENSTKKLLSKYVRLGEELKFDNLEIKWQKNPPAVEVDDFIDLEQLKASNPELVKTEYSLDKKRVKELHKAEKPLPQGIRIKQDFSMRIK